MKSSSRAPSVAKGGESNYRPSMAVIQDEEVKCLLLLSFHRNEGRKEERKECYVREWGYSIGGAAYMEVMATAYIMHKCL